MPRISPLSGDDLLHVRILWVGAMHVGRDWNAQDVRSSYWRFYVNSRDGASLMLPGGERYRLAAGRIHFVPAWVRFSCHNLHPLDHFFVHFDPVGIPGAVVREVFPRPMTLPSDAGMEQSAQRLHRLIAEQQLPTPVALCEIKAVLYRSLAALFGRLPAQAIARFHALAGDGNPVAKALSYIEDHLVEPLANPRLAGLCSLSEDHFIRRFREQIGQTPAQYIQERRVAMAAQRLLYSPDPIDAIARDCGFPDRYYFTRVFTKRMGRSPARYRSSGKI